MDRDELIREALPMSELPAPHTWKAPAHDPLCRQQHWEGGDCFDCRLIDKVRADERARILDSLHTQRELADDDQRWADLRAKVEALRGKWQRSVDRDPDGKLSGYDRAHVAALGDVLALLDGSSNG